MGMPCPPNVMPLSRYQGNNDPSLIAVAGSSGGLDNTQLPSLLALWNVDKAAESITRHVWEAKPENRSDRSTYHGSKKILLKPIPTSIPKTTPTTKPAQEPANRILIE